MFEHINDFKKRRLKATFSSKPFSKRKLADSFAFALCKDLRNSGLEILHETQKDTRVQLVTEVGHKFFIRPDAVVLCNRQPKVYVEIKYMEEGIFNTPDTRKIAYDFLHFRQKHKNEFYIVVSGAKLAAHKDVEPMLQAFTDRVFDININREHWESRLQNMVEELQKMLAMRPEKDVSLSCYRVKYIELGAAAIRSVGEDSSMQSLSYVTLKGIEFEKRLKKALTEARIEFEPKTGRLGRKIRLPKDNVITIAPDVWIPSLTDPKLVLECKNMKHLNDSFAKTVAMDSVLLKTNIPSLQFVVVCGERTRTISTEYMKGYVDKVITHDKIPSFVNYLRSLSRVHIN